MIGKAIAGWIGSRIDRQDGEGGALGAAVGVAVWEVGKRIVPAALLVGAVAYGAHRLSKALERDDPASPDA